MSSNLVWSIKNGDAENVREIFEKEKLDANLMIDGRRPLHYAADYGQKEIIEYLITKQGADVNALDKHNISPLLAAIWEGHTECVRLLIANGAQINGRTPGRPQLPRGGREGGDQVDALRMNREQ
ncbi:hypothetical protein TYRP_015221 [Tyrophagus putrescentiae]|nr:hypothetical protein TYRP_015221 [Tyrophagus putrescentiae]